MSDSRNSPPIVILLDSRQLGGIETHVYHLAKALTNEKLPVEVWLYKKHTTEPHPLAVKLTEAHIHVEYLSGSIKSLYLRMKQERPTLLHTHGYKAGVLGRLVACINKTPIVSTFHNGDRGTGLVRIYTMLDKLTSALSENIAVSDEIAMRLGSKTTVINNFIDLPEQQPQKGRNIAFVGRLSFEKGPDLFLRVAHQNPTLPFQIFGSGPMEPHLKESLPDNVEMVGQVPDMDEYWHDIGLLCISSREEGLPMVALEAMARGIPVAAFRLGALPKLIQQNINGWIAPQGNLPILCELIQYWSGLQPNKLRDLSQRCYQTISRHYSYEAVTPEITSIYKKSLQKYGANCPFPETVTKSPAAFDLSE